MYSEIPIFFSTDDNYIPYLDLAISSLASNASKDYRYRIIVLNTGLDQDNIDMVKRNETDCFKIDFYDISNNIEHIKSRFKNVYHFSIVTYYRLFIASIFPQYKKVIYLDCDLVVLDDISKLYNTDLHGKIVAAVPDQHVGSTKEFREYAQKAITVDPDEYFNAGVLLIDLEQFRKNDIEGKFIDLLTNYDFDLLDPDQAFLNYLCSDSKIILPYKWNKEPLPFGDECEKSIVHYALYKKPWQYDDVIDGDYFWRYAKKSPFYEKIVANKAAFGEKEKRAHKAAAVEIIEHAKRIIASDYTFATMIKRR